METTYLTSQWGKHGAEICELTWLLLLNGLEKIIPGLEVGFYRDDGIVALNTKQVV